MNRVLVLAALAFLVTSAAAADRLVTREGGVLQTAGPWRVEGKVVVFTLPDGRLSSLRLRDVDLEASEVLREATRKAAEADIEGANTGDSTPVPTPEPLWIITDDDVRHVEQVPAYPVEPAESTSTGSNQALAPRETKVRVSRWVRSSEPEVDGLVISGEILNPTDHVAAGLGLTVLLFDREGELLESVAAQLTTASLQPGEIARFRSEMPGVFTFSAAKFDVEAILLATSSPD